MKSNLYVPLLVCALIIGGGSFYAGMRFEKSVAPTGRQNADGFRGARGFGGGAGKNAGGSGGFANGEVVSKDSTSMTIKLRDGGSKIVFYSSSTTVGKIASGTMDDVIVGEDVSVNGAANPDGSVTAAMIQIRPAGIGAPREPRATSTQ